VALIRTEELEGFLDGLFGRKESLDLPERAHRAVTVLSQIRAMWKNMRDVAEDPIRPVSADDITGILGRTRELTKIGEHEIHEAMLS
jgi:hypothetical protein